jgi:hypothetical protein
MAFRTDYPWATLRLLQHKKAVLLGDEAGETVREILSLS